MTQGSDTGEAWTSDSSVSSQALYHCGPKIIGMVTVLHVFGNQILEIRPLKTNKAK